MREHQILRGRTFESGGVLYCDECCNGDRCDDNAHRLREKCHYCHGEGRPVMALIFDLRSRLAAAESALKIAKAEAFEEAAKIIHWCCIEGCALELEDKAREARVQSADGGKA